MSMVKAYHGKKCCDLQLCCSSWSMDTFSRNDLLTKNFQMEEEEDKKWNWKCPSKSSQICNEEKMESWTESENLKFPPLEPPLQFQDNPVTSSLNKFVTDFISKLLSDAFLVSCKITWSIPCSQDCHMSDSLPVDNSLSWNGLRLCWTPELLPRNKRLSTACLSASHNSLSTISSGNMDDSSYIKSAVSHDVLTSKQISDMYNVPFDSDIYAVPVDMVQGNKSSSPVQSTKSLRRDKFYDSPASASESYVHSPKKSSQKEGGAGNRSRKSRCASADPSSVEPIHVTVEEVRQYLRTLYSSSNETPHNKYCQETTKHLKNPFKTLQNSSNINHEEIRQNSPKIRGNLVFSGKTKKAKENVDGKLEHREKFKKPSACRLSFSVNFKETLCNIFRIKKLPSPDHCLGRREIGSRSDEIGIRLSGHDDQNPPSPITKPPFSKRALPPLPKFDDNHGDIIVTDSTPLPSPEEVPPPPPLPFRTKDPPSACVDFASSIEKVKDYGWYWGPISGEAAEKILSNEPDGSFIVRDSSDDYYIFSLTFKLNSIIRHVRIEHDKGNFSFGSSTRFKSHTIVDFIESAVEHSRSGRYLFFLHRRPVLGPMRVQLLHPVSRFKQVQSLQHMCRFVILKMVRKDFIRDLPLPRRVLDYLSTQHYYSEDLPEERNDSSREDLDQLLPLKQEVFS